MGLGDSRHPNPPPAGEGAGLDSGVRRMTDDGNDSGLHGGLKSGV